MNGVLFRNISLAPMVYMLLFYMPILNIDIGFHLKAFMVLSVILFFSFVAKGVGKIEVSQYDYAFIFFIFYGGVTVFFSIDILSGIRMFVGGCLVFFCYLVFKMYFISKDFSVDDIERFFYRASLIFIVGSLLMYFAGFFTIAGGYSNYERARVFGILVERGMPRMIGLLSDPNIFAMYTSLIFFYLLGRANKVLYDYIFLLMVVFSLFLTLSRGGILAIFLSTVLYFSYAVFSSAGRMRVNIKIVSGFLIFLFVSFVFFIVLLKGSYFSDFFEFIERRMSSASEGSGRFEIWGNLLSLWSENPIFGIGLYNFLYYNVEVFGGNNYAHNTFLEVLVETGVIGFFIYSIFHFLILIKILSLMRIDARFTYFLFGYISLIVMFNSLSVVINEYFFMFLGLLSVLHAKSRSLASA